MKIKTLSWLLHHGNRYNKNENFYRIKKQLLLKYGKLTEYEYQYIEGKSCWSCEGTGIYHKYYFFDKRQTKEQCWSCCGTGQYKQECWNQLAVYSFGKYTFHIPYSRQFTKPPIGVRVFEGYISHSSSYWSRFAQIVIMTLFDFKGYRKSWRTQLGGGWRSWAWRPATILNNIAWIIKHPKRLIPKISFNEINEELPF